MTTTRRRTARITTDAQPTTKSKPVYEGVVIARVFSKTTGALLGYLAKPSKPLGEKGRVLPWYRVTRDAHDMLHCNCEAHGDCKHKTAVLEIEAIHKAEERAAAQHIEPAASEEQPTAEQSAPVAPTAQPDEMPQLTKAPANVLVFTDSRRQPRQTARSMPAARYNDPDPPKGELRCGSQRRGGFTEACFGSLQGDVRAARAAK